MKLTDRTWYVSCRSVAEKHQFLEFAKACGMDYNGLSYRDDDLHISIGHSFVEGTSGTFKLFSYSLPSVASRKHISTAEFRILCEEHAGWKTVVVEDPVFMLTETMGPAAEQLDTRPLAYEYLYGLNLIHEEREKQILKGNGTVLKDDRYQNGELREFSTYWLSAETEHSLREAIKQNLVYVGWKKGAFTYDAKTPEQRLAIAGALIAAELDRLHRLSQKK